VLNVSSISLKLRALKFRSLKTASKLGDQERLQRNKNRKKRKKKNTSNYTGSVTPIPDVSRKSSTCVNISTGYIKLYNINYIRMNIYTTNCVRT
jgi:hypothetical protein